MFGAGPAVPGASGQMHRERAEVARELRQIICHDWADDYRMRIIIEQGRLVPLSLFVHGENDAESGLSGNHLVVGVGGFFQGVALDHGAYAAEGTEFKRVLR